MEIKAYTLKSRGKEFHLTEPTFDVISIAMQEYISGNGKLNLVGAGKIVFDACYLGDDIEEIQKDVKLYANLCLQCASIVEFEEVEIKKN